jgi:hypothetical protein
MILSAVLVPMLSTAANAVSVESLINGQSAPFPSMKPTLCMHKRMSGIETTQAGYTDGRL